MLCLQNLPEPARSSLFVIWFLQFSILLDEYVFWGVSINTVGPFRKIWLHCPYKMSLSIAFIQHKILKVMAVISVNRYSLSRNRRRSNNSGNLLISLFQASLNKNYSVNAGDSFKLNSPPLTPIPRQFYFFTHNPRIDVSAREKLNYRYSKLQHWCFWKLYHFSNTNNFVPVN